MFFLGLARHVLTVSLMLVLPASVAAVLQAQSPAFVPVTDAMLQDPPPEDWLMWRRTLDGWGYSPLHQGHHLALLTRLPVRA